MALYRRQQDIVDLRLKDEDDVVHHLEQEPAAVGTFYSDGRLGFHLENDEGLVYWVETDDLIGRGCKGALVAPAEGAAPRPLLAKERTGPALRQASESLNDPRLGDARTMALISMRQMLDHAAEFGYGVPAFNVNNLEQMRAIMEAADKTDSPVIVRLPPVLANTPARPSCAT